MAHGETERAKGPKTSKAESRRPHIGADVETTESGPPRLYAPPGRPQPVESGPPLRANWQPKATTSDWSGAGPNCSKLWQMN